MGREKTEKKQIAIMDSAGKDEQEYRKSSVRRAIMNRQMRRAVQLVFGFLLSFGPWSLPAVFASVACTQFAIAFTDTGHQGSFLDGSWALFDQAKQDDYLFRGVHVTAVSAKTITNNFYGRRPRSYFAGCSDE